MNKHGRQLDKMVTKYQYFPLLDLPKNTQIGIFGLKIYHLATLKRAQKIHSLIQKGHFWRLSRQTKRSERSGGLRRLWPCRGWMRPRGWRRSPARRPRRSRRKTRSCCGRRPWNRKVSAGQDDDLQNLFYVSWGQFSKHEIDPGWWNPLIPRA
jgi:hypothetical protein